MPKVRRLFVDPGFSSGWALFEGKKLLEHGSVVVKGTDWSRYFEMFAAYRALICTANVEEIHVEDFPKSKVHQKLLWGIGALQAAAGHSETPCFKDCWMNDWQKYHGYSKRKKTVGILKKYLKAVQTDDELSAIGIGLWYLNTQL